MKTFFQLREQLESILEEAEPQAKFSGKHNVAFDYDDDDEDAEADHNEIEHNKQKAFDHKKKADAAKKAGDQSAYHKHMAAHHDHAANFRQDVGNEHGGHPSDTEASHRKAHEWHKNKA